MSMDFGYQWPLEVTDQNLITIGRFIHRCGLFEDAITKRIEILGLANKLKPIKKRNRKREWVPLEQKIRVLKEFCKKPSRILTDKEEERLPLVEKALHLFEKENGVRDLRNAIAHEPILVSVMGAWQPGPGYIKEYGPIYVRPQTGEEIEVLATWSFDEIDSLSDELLVLLDYLGYIPKELV